MRTDGAKGVNVMITSKFLTHPLKQPHLIPQKMETKEKKKKKKHTRKNNNVKTQESNPLGI